MSQRTSFRHLLCAAISALSLSACGTPPREQFYTLNAAPLTSGKAGSPLLVVAQVSLPEMLDRPQIVLRNGEHQIHLLELQRWAEPLKSNFSAALAGQLQTQLPDWQLAMREQHSSRDAKWELWLDVQRFDLTPQQSTLLVASWQLRQREGQLSQRGQSSISEECKGCEIPALIAAQQRAIGKLAQEIAHQAKRLQATQP